MADDFQELIRQVKEANDIVDVVSGYVALTPAGQSYKGLCPFHDDQRPSFDVDRTRQRYRCWACGKFGDVITFIQEQDRVNFLEALELLARRVGISLEKNGKFRQNPGRAIMLEVVSWAERQFQFCLLKSNLGDEARTYLAERGLEHETIDRFGLGFAPAEGNWLLAKARHDGISLEQMEETGLIAKRKEGTGHYDRFRDRVMFPIRNAQGRTVGFGGRILPNSPNASRAPKYYNSAETPLFNKSELLYGLDQARQSATKKGYLAVVEGYTDVLMAHQKGLDQVVATMGTALNDRHVRQLKRWAPRIILVFDADAGGSTGVDRALEVFATEDIALQVATLPEGLDPCDLLLQKGAENFEENLTAAKDVLDFKLNQVCAAHEDEGLEGKRRAVDEVLRIIAKGPRLVPQSDQVKRELMMSQIAQRFGIREETLWNSLRELRGEQQRPAPPEEYEESEDQETLQRSAPAKAHERELVELLLAEPRLVPEAAREIAADKIGHPGLRQLVDGLYRLHAEGEKPTLDELRTRIDNPALISKAFELQETGNENADRQSWWQGLLHRFREIDYESNRPEVQQRLQTASDLDAQAEILRMLQDRKSG